MNAMYVIFICVSIQFGEWERLAYCDKNIANAVAMDFINQGTPVITFHENKVKTWNAFQHHQPRKVKISEYPTIEKVANRFGSSVLLDCDWLGALQLRAWNLRPESGVKVVLNAFYDYKGKMLCYTQTYE